MKNWKSKKGCHLSKMTTHNSSMINIFLEKSLKDSAPSLAGMYQKDVGGRPAYLDEGVNLLELAQHAVIIYEKTDRSGKASNHQFRLFELDLQGWVPHESQQKPLARGSAKMRLADALNPKQN